MRIFKGIIGFITAPIFALGILICSPLAGFGQSYKKNQYIWEWLLK